MTFIIEKDPGLIPQIHSGILDPRVSRMNYRKNSELFYSHLAVTSLLDPDGKAFYFLGVQYDVTQRIHDKKKIKRLTDRPESLRK